MTQTNRRSLAQWLCVQRYLPYRFRKSVVKRIYPKILLDHSFEMDFFGMKYTGNARDYIDRMVYFCGAYEKYMLYFLRDTALAMRLKDLIFIDVGANVGNHSLFMSQFADHVHAFEPYEFVRNQLKQKVTNNNIKNVHIHPVGLGRKDEKIAYYAGPDSNLGAGSFVDNHHGQSRYIADLPIVTGDNEIKRLKLSHIDFIKMNVEGFERYVIEGLHHSLSTFRPIIILELSDTTRDTFKDFEDFRSVFPPEYDFLRFSKASRDFGGYRIAMMEYETHYKRHNVIACPHEKLKHIQHLEVR